MSYFAIVSLSFRVSKFPVSRNLETSENQRKPGFNFHILLMPSGPSVGPRVSRSSAREGATRQWSCRSLHTVTPAALGRACRQCGGCHRRGAAWPCLVCRGRSCSRSGRRRGMHVLLTAVPGRVGVICLWETEGGRRSGR